MVNVSFDGSPLGSTFAWTNDNPAIGLPATGSGNIAFASANVSSSEVANITVTPVIGPCSGEPVTFTITVNPVPPTNLPPTANAGPDQSVASGAAVTLSGSGSDPDVGDVLSYAWPQTGGSLLDRAI